MASTPFLNNQVGFKIDPGSGAVDLSDHVTNVTLNRSFNELLVTAMGDSGQRQIKGLEANSLTIDLINDTTSGSVMQTLQSCFGKNVTVTLLQNKGTAVSATNPLYTMTCLVNNTTDINGAVGDLAMQNVTWNISGVIAITNTGSF
jgi:hypothetical protein